MKKTISLFLITILCIPIGIKLGIYIQFKLNQDVIAKAYCKNKDKPEMECNGQCHLAEKILEVEAIENNTPESSNFPFEKNHFKFQILKIDLT